MIYKLYTTSQKAWDGMFKAMTAAKKSIYLEMYIFLDDTQATHNFLGLLEEKARAGLDVAIIADAYGSKSLSAAAVSGLKAAGADFIYFSHWLKHTHRKILIIDNQTAFIGGVNIKEKIRNWRDLQIRVQGRVVKPLLQSFAYSYKSVGGKKESILQFSRRPLVKKLKSWIIDNLATTNKIYTLNEYYRERISSAKTRIQIVTPYLLPPRWLLRQLDEACRRGVALDIIIPNDTDIKPINKINYLNACRMSEFGAKFYLLPLMNHAKVMLIDNEEGIIGSQNIDVLSFNWNSEAGVFSRQKDLVNDLGRLIEKWKGEAMPFTAAQRRVKFTDRILIDFFKLFYPIF